MAETIEKRLREALSGLPPEDAHAVAAFAEFLARRRQISQSQVELLPDEEHAGIVVAMDAVAALSTEQGPPVSNREHDRYLYGGK